MADGGNQGPFGEKNFFIPNLHWRVRTISSGRNLGGITQSGTDDRLPEASTTARSEK
jgi:hypothetical protein